MRLKNSFGLAARACVRALKRRREAGGKIGVSMKHALHESQIPCGPKQQGINVMTLHASKGLEFPVVYLPGIQENNLPHWNAINDGKTAIEEERRLFYVGVTRAGHTLTLSATRRRGPYSCQRSRFAAHLIDEALVEHHDLAT